MLNLYSRLGLKIAASLGERVDYGCTPSRHEFNRFFELYPLSTLLPYQAYSPAQGIFDNSGSAGFVFETSPLVGCSEPMQREIAGLFQHTLTEGSSIQFLLWADPRIGRLLEAWEEKRNNAPEIFQTLSHRRVHFLEGHVFESPLEAPLRDFRCIVSYCQSVEISNPVEMQKFLQLKDQI